MREKQKPYERRVREYSSARFGSRQVSLLDAFVGARGRRVCRVRGRSTGHGVGRKEGRRVVGEDRGAFLPEEAFLMGKGATSFTGHLATLA